MKYDPEKPQIQKEGLEKILTSEYLVESFDVWNPENEEKDEYLWRFMNHMLRKILEKDLFKYITPEPVENITNKETYFRWMIFDAIASGSERLLSSQFFKEEKKVIGKAIRDAFDTILESILDRNDSYNKFSSLHKEKTLNNFMNIVYTKDLGKGYIPLDASLPDTSILDINIGEDFLQKTSYFNKTNNSRIFWDSDNKKEVEESLEVIRAANGLCALLFGLPFVTDIGIRYLKKHIDGKKIGLLGGGVSLEDLIGDARFSAEKVVNIDPYITHESYEKNSRGNYKSLSIDALDLDIDKKLKSEGEDQFDELWCTHSVPHYIKDPEGFHVFFENIRKLLVVGGVCRIFPIHLYRLDDYPKEDEPDRVSEYIEAVKEIIDDENYNVSVSGGLYDSSDMNYEDADYSTLIIRRIK